MKKYHLYGIGNALLDAEFLVQDEFIRTLGILKGRMTLADSKKQEEAFKLLKDYKAEFKSGGSAANTVVGLSQYGAKCFFSGRIGSDALGDLYYKDLRKNAVDTNIDEHRGEELTGSALALITEDAQRTFQSYLGASKFFSRENLSLENIKKSHYFYIEAYLLSEENAFDAILYAGKEAQKSDTKLILNFSDANIVENYRERLYEVLELGIDILFCNKEEALSFAKEDNLKEAEKLVSKLAKTVVITMGDEGLILFENGELIAQIPSVPVQAVDTNGAGDFFAASYIYAITCAKTSLDAARFANMAASKIVRFKGPRLSREEVKRIKAEYIYAD